MEERILGRTGRAVSVIGLGTWQLGADWGQVDEADALAVLEAAAQAGVTFLDTADVYGDGRSERLIGQFLAANHGLPMTVGTKMGRRSILHVQIFGENGSEGIDVGGHVTPVVEATMRI